MIRLSLRQKEISALVAQGMPNKQIAHATGLSEGTIKDYMYDIFKKCDVKNRVGLAILIHKNPNLLTD